jgi:hypothetical protein
MRRFSTLHFEPTADPAEGAAGGEGDPLVPAATEATTFAQADVDRIVRERLARQKAQFADYDDLKTAATELAELKAASQSDLEKAQNRVAELEAKATAAEERAQRTLVDSALAAAASSKLADPTDAAAFIDRASITFDEAGAPNNVAELVDALVTAKPHLAAGPRRVPPVDQGAQGGAAATTAEAVMQLDDAGFLAALRDPSIAKTLRSS